MNDALVPVALPPPPGADAWARAACGETHSAALAVGGAVLSWGVPDDGRLGIAPLPDDIVWLPTAVEGVPEDPLQIACGDAFTAVLTASGELWAWGSNLDGQLGLGDDGERDSQRPLRLTALDGQRIRQVACGGMHSVALTFDGKLFSWGCNDDDSLGRGGEESEAHPVGGALAGAEVAMVTAGDSHTAALTRDGKVYSWGT